MPPTPGSTDSSAGTPGHASTSAAAGLVGPSLEAIRARFPALSTRTALLENAGGSQVPEEVADAIRGYMLNSYVQLGAGYDISTLSTETVALAHEFVNELFGGTTTGHAILGSSSTQLLTMLAECWRPLIRPGDEIVLAENAHEANVGPWLRLEEQGAVIRWWRVDRELMDCTLAGLDAVLSERTRLVAFPHVSNLLGAIAPLEPILARVHAVGARAVVDGVAYAPHRAMDVAAWNVDWYVYSTYKVYGPHMAALYGRHDAVDELTGPNHFFIPADEVPYKLEPGGVSHEGCAGLLGLRPYLGFLAGQPEHAATTRATVERAFERVERAETALQARLIERLAPIPGVRLVGPADADPATRVATVSFVHERRSSREIAVAANERGFGIRYGHFYAHRLCSRLAELGVLHGAEDGVVRVSMVHYNTADEIDGLADLLGSLPV